MPVKKEKLSLDHQELLKERFRKAGTFLSEYSFANLYLFREAHQYHMMHTEGGVFVTGRTYDGMSFIMPTEDLRAGDPGPLLEAAKDFDFIFPVPEEWLPVFDGKSVSAEFSEDDSDYVYTTEKLSTYKGHKLHGQKNLLNQFVSRYAPEAKPLTHDLMNDARGILDVWQEDMGQPKEATDYFPACEALELYDKLALCGGIYYVDGEPGGYVIGEEIHPEMFALHFAKGKRKFKGLYQYMYNHFAKILPKQYAFLNFEQDLGKLALRIAKSSYDPDRSLRKYRIKIS